MWSIIEERLMAGFCNHGDVQTMLRALEHDVRQGAVPPGAAAARLLEAYRS